MTLKGNLFTIMPVIWNSSVLQQKLFNCYCSRLSLICPSFPSFLLSSLSSFLPSFPANVCKLGHCRSKASRWLAGRRRCSSCLAQRHHYTSIQTRVYFGLGPLFGTIPSASCVSAKLWAECPFFDRTGTCCSSYTVCIFCWVVFFLFFFLRVIFAANSWRKHFIV